MNDQNTDTVEDTRTPAIQTKKARATYTVRQLRFQQHPEKQAG